MPTLRRQKREITVAQPLSLIAIILLCSFFLSGAPPEKHLAVFSTAANYSVAIAQHDGHDYVGLIELLEPLGRVSAKTDGNRWRLHYNNIEAEFQSEKTRVKIQGRDLDMGGKFQLNNDRGLVPVGSLSSLLPRLLGGPVTMHEESDRLFIGSVGTHFTASLAAANPPKLVLNFTAPVNPTIATEAGTLRMTFAHEPLMAPASPTLTFGNKQIPSANYSESNAAASITVTATIPVIANFSSDGKTITISPAPSAAQNQGAAQGTASSGAPAATATPQVGSPASTAPSARKYFAVVDASHGGDDHGETLSGALLEKDVTLALAHSLKQELESRGITTLVLRDSDANLSFDQRAIATNGDHAAIYIALHATSSGRGVRVYTALLPYGEDDRGPFKSWTTAQRAAHPLSQSMASAVAGELQKRQVPVRALLAPLRPLNNMLGAAIAVEVAPQGADASQLMAPDYQQLVMSAVATALAANRDQLAGAP